MAQRGTFKNLLFVSEIIKRYPNDDEWLMLRLNCRKKREFVHVLFVASVFWRDCDDDDDT